MNVQHSICPKKKSDLLGFEISSNAAAWFREHPGLEAKGENANDPKKRKENDDE